AIWGFAYVDSIRNYVKDASEPGLGGVLITLSNGATTTTAADGSYSFTNVSAGSYTVSAAATASGYTLGTPSPLSVTVALNQTTANVNFGYITSAPPSGGLTVTKSANTGTYFYAGQVIVYTYVIRNASTTVSYSGPFSITDDKLGTFQCSSAVLLAPGASTSCTYNYTIQPSDLGTVSALPSGVVATVYTGAWLQGVMSTQDTT